MNLRVQQARFIGSVAFIMGTMSGCSHTCLKAKNLQPTTGTNLIVEKNAEVRAAVLPSGDPSPLQVKTYCPTEVADQRLVVGWSKSNASELASIAFPAGHFGNGPSTVEIEMCHYYGGALTAYDADGNQIASAEHDAGQNTDQVLTLSGGAIRRIDITGAEIGILSICWDD